MPHVGRHPSQALFSTDRPSTRLKSRSLFVTGIHASARAWAAIHRSLLPADGHSEPVPFLRRSIAAIIRHEFHGHFGECVEYGGRAGRQFSQDDFVASAKDLHLVGGESKFPWQANRLAVA